MERSDVAFLDPLDDEIQQAVPAFLDTPDDSLEYSENLGSRSNDQAVLFDDLDFSELFEMDDSSENERKQTNKRPSSKRPKK